MSRGYNTNIQHALKEKAINIIADKCHKNAMMAQIMPSLTWLDIKIFNEKNVYDKNTSFFAYEIRHKNLFENMFMQKYENIFNQPIKNHFGYSKTDITLDDKSFGFRKKVSSRYHTLKFDIGFYDLCCCYYRFPEWFDEKHWNRFTRDADILFTFDLDKNGRTAVKRDYPILINKYFSDFSYPKVKYDLSMFELRENYDKGNIINKTNAIINCMRNKGLFTDTVCIYQDLGSIMGVFHCRKIRGFYKEQK